MTVRSAYPHDWPFSKVAAPRFVETKVEVTSLDALREAGALVAQGLNPVVLNFASARNPGGGWRLEGVSGQEEDLCRATALGRHLESEKAQWFYEHHLKCGPMNSAAMLYVKDVEVWHADWRCVFIVCAAPNARYVSGEDRLSRLGHAFADRTRRVFKAAIEHGHDAIILGAWGCGAFHNDPAMVVDEFTLAITELGAHFKNITFAVPDSGLRRGPFWRLRGMKCV